MATAMLDDDLNESCTVHREVKWVKVAERWTRMSLMTNVNTHPEAQQANTNANNSSNSINFLFIPGNCGNEGYYEEFGRQLIPLVASAHHTRTQVSYYTVSHLNHVKVPANLIGGRAQRCDRFTLDEQIQHKRVFCAQYLPKTGRLFVFGHSIGCYVALRLLPYLRDEGWDLQMGYMLYPAIERLADTPNGARLKPIANFMTKHDRATQLMFCWLKFTPNWAKKGFVRASLRIYGKSPQCIIDAGAEAFNIDVMRNVGFITDVEMRQIVDFDETLLAAKPHIRLYYGDDDAWILPEFVDRMKRRLPGQVLLDEEQCHHAFCIKDNKMMARVVAKLMLHHNSVAAIEQEEKEGDDSAKPPLTTRIHTRLSSLVADWFF